jgi:hypothetical protein
LIDRAAYRMSNQLVMPVTPSLPKIVLGKKIAFVVSCIGVNTGKCASATSGSPSTRTLTIRDRNTLAPLNEGQGVTTRHTHGIQLKAQWHISQFKG